MTLVLRDQNGRPQKYRTKTCYRCLACGWTKGSTSGIQAQFAHAVGDKGRHKSCDMTTPRILELLGVPELVDRLWVPWLTVPLEAVKRYTRERQIQSDAHVAYRREDHQPLPDCGHSEDHPLPSESIRLQHPPPSDSGRREHLSLDYDSVDLLDFDSTDPVADSVLLDSGRREDHQTSVLPAVLLPGSGRSEHLPDDPDSLDDLSLEDFDSLDLDHGSPEDLQLPAEEEQQGLVQPAVEEQHLPAVEEQQSSLFTDGQLQYLMVHGFAEPQSTYLDVTTVLTWRGRVVRLVPISNAVTTLRRSLQEIFRCCTIATTSGTWVIRMTLIQAEVYFLLFMYSIISI